MTANVCNMGCQSVSCCVNSLVNLSLIAAVALPAVIVGNWIHSNPNCEEYRNNENVYKLCDMGLKDPVMFVNVVMFFNMCVLFWFVSLIQKSCWLIGSYLLIPCDISFSSVSRCLLDFYTTNDWNVLQVSSILCVCCLWLQLPHETPQWFSLCIALCLGGKVVNRTNHWKQFFSSVDRLTHSYFRREQWVVGGREDWRFQDMRKNMGFLWYPISFVCEISLWVFLFDMKCVCSLQRLWFSIPCWRALRCHTMCWTTRVPSPTRFLPSECSTCWFSAALFPVCWLVTWPTHSCTSISRSISDANTSACRLWRSWTLVCGTIPVIRITLEKCCGGNSLLTTALCRCSTRCRGSLSVGYGLLLKQPWIIGGWVINTVVMVISMNMIESHMLKHSDNEKALQYKYYMDYTSYLFPWPSSRDSYLCAVASDSKRNK